MGGGGIFSAVLQSIASTILVDASSTQKERKHKVGRARAGHSLDSTLKQIVADVPFYEQEAVDSYIDVIEIAECTNHEQICRLLPIWIALKRLKRRSKINHVIVPIRNQKVFGYVLLKYVLGAALGGTTTLP